jgi:hypothetical protein
MSTTYRPIGKGIRFDSLRERLEPQGVEFDGTAQGTTDDAFPMCFAGNWLWVHRHGKQGTTFVRYGANNPVPLLDLLENTFDVEIIPEHDDRQP